jgi:hypothetical protein
MQSHLGTPGTRKDKSTGIFPVQAPDEVLVPWVVYQQVSGQPLQTSMQGTGRLHTARMRFSCFGSTYKQAKQLAQALKASMLACFGTMPTGDTIVQGSWLSLELDQAEPLPRGTIFCTITDFMLVFLDTAS